MSPRFPRCTTYATSPLGKKRGWLSASGVRVSGRGFSPSDSITNRSGLPSRVETNAMKRPSDEYTGD
jgi:hypothetical protein